MIVEETNLKEVKVVIPDVHDDQRGYFFESYNSKSFETHLIPHHYLQDNEVKSKKNTLRGLHYQLNNPQGKLVRVVSGEILDVAVDIRLGSPTFGKHVIKKLSSQNKRMLYVPEGFAHGYIVLSEESIVIYKCTNVWIPNDEHGISWNDPSLAINWGNKYPILSEKDLSLPMLEEQKNLPTYK